MTDGFQETKLINSGWWVLISALELLSKTVWNHCQRILYHSATCSSGQYILWLHSPEVLPHIGPQVFP